MRQSGILAAAGIHALNHHRSRLPDDHRRAKDLSRGASKIPGVQGAEPDTNIVMLDFPDSTVPVHTILKGLKSRDVLMVQFGPRRIRAVTHLDVDDDGIERALAALEEVMTAGS